MPADLQKSPAGVAVVVSPSFAKTRFEKVEIGQSSLALLRAALPRVFQKVVFLEDLSSVIPASSHFPSAVLSITLNMGGVSFPPGSHQGCVGCPHMEGTAAFLHALNPQLSVITPLF